MQTQTLVRASADVVTVTTLRPGDVYKRLVKDWRNEYVATFGIVQTVDHNGVAAMISSLEISTGKVEHRVFGTDTDLQIFATTPAEVEHALAEHHESLMTAHRAAQDALDKASAALDRFDQIKDQIDSHTVQQPTVVRSTLAAEEITA
jgi:hypothetical protein